jgi:hypothetical protein
MAVPASFLQHVEQHGCFSGCFGNESDVSICLDPARPLQPLLVVSCRDCFTKVGVPRTLLPAGASSSWLADQVTQHLRRLRGFTLAFSGYHARGPGFWLSAAYYGGCGLFLVNGERSRSLGSDLDLLLLAFKHSVVPPPDPRMLDAKQYSAQVVYVNYAGPATAVACKQDLLSSSHCRLQPAPGFERVTLAEFQPLARAAAAPAAAAAARKPAARPLKVGDVCPVCGHEVRERSLLQGTFVGCMC